MTTFFLYLPNTYWIKRFENGGYLRVGMVGAPKLLFCSDYQDMTILLVLHI